MIPMEPCGMDYDEAVQDVQMLKGVAAGLTRKRDDIHVFIAAIHRVGGKWLKRGVSRALRSKVMWHEGVHLDPRTIKIFFGF